MPIPSPRAREKIVHTAEWAWPKGAPARPIAVHRLYNDGVYEQILEWLAEAMACLEAWKKGEKGTTPAARAFTAADQSSWAAEVVWDASDPDDCVPV